MHCEQLKHEHNIHNMNEKKKKIKVAPPCAVPSAFPNTVEVFFSDCSANKILHPLHLRGLRILWSLSESCTSSLKRLLENYINTVTQ